jgi:hypothetical protein
LAALKIPNSQGVVILDHSFTSNRDRSCISGRTGSTIDLLGALDDFSPGPSKNSVQSTVRSGGTGRNPEVGMDGYRYRLTV